MHYRKEIDGLRAVAILPVIWIHSGLPYITGGFLGVDVFFVISGFLITSILTRELEAGNFSLATFYERRARRILPALMFVVIITSIFVPLISDHPKFISDFGNSVFSTIFFVSNVYFWQTSGYFGSTSELSPMLHTWSLAVEEQYYILFPLLIMFLFSFGKKTIVVAVLIFIAICSLLISEWGAINSSVGNFYLLPSRAWELIAGALAAIFYYSAVLSKIRKGFSTFLSGTGITLILSAYLLFTPSTLHPSSLTILPVLGAVLVLLFSEQGNIVGKILSIKSLNFIGLISYSLYLWHQPILALMKNFYSLHLELSQTITAIVLTFSLSYLTWKYVETPFRDKKKYKQNRIFKLSIVSILVVSFCSLLFIENLHVQKIFFPEQMTRYEKMLQADKSHSNQVMFNSNCKFWSKEFNSRFINRFEECVKKYERAIFILGGSHGMDLYNAVSMNSINPFIVSVSQGFCRAHKFIGNLKHQPRCQYEDFEEFAGKYANNISYVMYTQTPDRLFKVQTLNKATSKDLSIKRIKEVVDYLGDIKTNYDLNVMMIGMLPPLTKPPISWSYKKPFDEQFNNIISTNSISLTKLVDNIFVSKLKKHEIPYISKFDGFTLDIPSDLIIGGNITYSDSRHISYSGEKIFGSRLINHLTNLGYSQFNQAN